MSIHKDITGQRFGRLTVIRHSHMKNHQSYWFCRCECGKFKHVRLDLLTRGQVKSCGCSHKGQNITHGKSKTKLYKVWSIMKDRCYNIKYSMVNKRIHRGWTIEQALELEQKT